MAGYEKPCIKKNPAHAMLVEVLAEVTGEGRQLRAGGLRQQRAVGNTHTGTCAITSITSM